MTISTTKGAALEVRDLDFAYPRGEFRLRIPSLQVAAGSRAAFVGPSGSGKSTLLALAAGILLPDAGTLTTRGLDWSRASEAERRFARIQWIGQVFQDFELLPYLDVRENILLPYFVHPGLQLDAAARERLAGLADRTGIGALLDARPGRLSRGERQRVALCRALIRDPALVLADEPTGSLDPASTRAVMDLLREEVARLGATLLMVTHDAELVADFDQRVDFADFHAGVAR